MTSPRRTWAERIEAATKRGRFTVPETRMVRRGHQCAVGEAFHLKSDVEYGPRLSDAAQDLGWDFEYAVIDGDIAEASRLYDRIQALAAKERAK